jgi:hypothetical protein
MIGRCSLRKVSVDEIVEIVDANNYYDFLFRPK